MTHDELLAKIDEALLGWKNYLQVELLPYKALRVVVELHKPGQFMECKGCDDRCGCGEGDYRNWNTWESCPTIKAIEEALK